MGTRAWMILAIVLGVIIIALLVALVVIPAPTSNASGKASTPTGSM
jgi:uncharacterized protein involved in exopolysaccharide biosynthesis